MADQLQTKPSVYAALTIALHPDGWKLHILNHDPPVRISISDVEQVARVVSDAVIAEGIEPTPYEYTRSATLGLKERVEQELIEAEATAKTIPALRKARQETQNIQ